MKAEELRIGNYVLNDRIINTVTSVNKNSIEQITPQGNHIISRAELIKSIPLTEQWLIDSGIRFKVIPKSFYGRYLEFTIDGALYYFFTKKSRIERHGSKMTYYYVHQLQNLYYALMSKELKFTKND